MYNSFSFFRLRILSYYLPAQEIYTSPYSWQTNPEKITGSIPYSETKFKGQLLRYCAKQISFSGTKLPIEKIETEACSQPPIDEAEIIKLIERRGLGEFVPFTADISPRLGISRSLACIHPADPGYFYKFVGIGIAHEQDNNIEIEPPTTARRMNDLPLQQGVMSQVIVMPDGSLLKSSDDSGLGGIEPDSGVFKIIKTAKINEIFCNSIPLPDFVGVYRYLHSNQECTVSRMPVSYDLNDVFKLEQYLISKGTLLESPLLTLAFLQHFRILRDIHDFDITHNQFHFANARILPQGATDKGILAADWASGKNVREYPENIKKKAKLFDFLHTASSLFSTLPKMLRTSMLPRVVAATNIGYFKEFTYPENNLFAEVDHETAIVERLVNSNQEAFDYLRTSFLSIFR